MAETPPELQAEIEKLERKHAENPEGRYFVPLANAYRKLGQLRRAESLLREGLRRHPEYLSAHIVLGRCLADGGFADQAAEEFRYVLSLDPQNLIALRSLGDLSLAQGKGDEARRWYGELLRADPMNDEARRALDSLHAPTVSSAPADPLPELRVPDAAPEADFAPGVAEPEPPVEGPAQDDLIFTGYADHLDPPEVEARLEEDELQRLDDFGLYAGYEEQGDELQDLPVLEEDPEPVTETIAELYARQGLYGRAAEVYRELIRRRGDDAGLRRRLADVERLAAGEPPFPAQVAAAAEAPSVDEEAGADAGIDLDLAGNSWPGDFVEPEPEVLVPRLDDQTVDVDDLAASEPQAAEPAQRTIAQFLATLAAWRPGAAPATDPESAEPASTALPAPAAEVPLDAGERRFSYGGTVTAGEDQFLRAEPEQSVVPPVEVADSEPEPVAYSEPAEDDLSLLDADPEEPPPAQAPPAAPKPRAVSVEDDDDLESFQAWLRSLKR